MMCAAFRYVACKPAARNGVSSAIGLGLRDRLLNVGLVVKCRRRVRLFVQPAGVEVRLQVRGVLEHDAHERARCRRRIDRAAESVTHEFGQIPDVVDVPVRYDHGIDIFCSDGQRHAVERNHVARPLEKTAVHQNVTSVYREQMFAAGYRSRGADKS